MDYEAKYEKLYKVSMILFYIATGSMCAAIFIGIFSLKLAIASSLIGIVALIIDVRVNKYWLGLIMKNNKERGLTK